MWLICGGWLAVAAGAVALLGKPGQHWKPHIMLNRQIYWIGHKDRLVGMTDAGVVDGVG